MTMYIGHASIDENGKISGGAAGDQTGKEVCKRTYYMHSQGWHLLRPKSIDHANAIAEAMLRACKNEKIGYDQGNRLGVIKYGTNTKTKTECDCSSLVRQCVIEGTGKDAGNFTTGNEATCLENTGLFEKRVSVTSSTVLYNGDILVTKTKGHTVIVVEGNPRPKKVTNTKVAYYPKYTGTSSGIDTVFRAIGVPEKFLGNYKNRTTIAKNNGVTGTYVGSAQQNLYLIDLAKKGKLKK